MTNNISSEIYIGEFSIFNQIFWDSVHRSGNERKHVSGTTLFLLTGSYITQFKLIGS